MTLIIKELQNGLEHNPGIGRRRVNYNPFDSSFSTKGCLHEDDSVGVYTHILLEQQVGADTDS